MAEVLVQSGGGGRRLDVVREGLAWCEEIAKLLKQNLLC